MKTLIVIFLGAILSLFFIVAPHIQALAVEAPILQAPSTHAACPQVATQDSLRVTGVGERQLKGQVVVQLISDMGRITYKTYTVDQTGDLALNVEYPPVSQWPILRGSNPPGTRELHVDVSIEVYEHGQLIKTLGPGQDWDLFCNADTSLPTLSTPQTYSSCPTTTTTDTIKVTNIGNRLVKGQVIVDYVVGTSRVQVPGGFYPINWMGPNDLALTVSYPPVSQWPSGELHVDIQLEVWENGQMIESLGPWQDWDVFCNNLPSASPLASPNVSPLPAMSAQPSVTVSPSVTPFAAPTANNQGGSSEGVGGGPVCADTKPANVTLLSATRNTPTTAVLKWNKVVGVNNYNIQYGLSSKNYTFGLSQTGDVDTVTIGSLDSNSNYCFVVRSSNGCQLSDQSNEICLHGSVLSAKEGQVLGVSTLAATGNFATQMGFGLQLLGLLLIGGGGFASIKLRH